MSANPYDIELAAQLYDEVQTAHEDLEVFLSLARRSGGPILELGCGTGRCLLPLVREGFDVVGIDASEPMLRKLQAKVQRESRDSGHRVSCILGDGRNFSMPIRFGMAFFASHSFGLISTRAEQEQSLSSVFAHLRPGGLLAIDTLNPTCERLTNARVERHAVGEYEILTRDSALNSAEQQLEIETTYRHNGNDVARIDWILRYSYRFELELLLEKIGYEVVSVWGDYLESQFSHASQRLFVVARKPKIDERIPPLESRVQVAQGV